MFDLPGWTRNPGPLLIPFADPAAYDLAVVHGFIDIVDFFNFELFADEFALKVPGFDEPWGTDMLFQAIKSHYTAFPDWTHVIEDVVAEGEKVAVKLNQNGTHEAEYEGIPATGVEATLPAMHLFTVKNGKVVDWFAVEDYLGLYMQLGYEMKPKEGEK